MDKLTIRRDAKRQDSLQVSERDGLLSLIVSGGGNVTASEVEQITVHVAGHPDADRFLAKLNARAGR